MIYHPYGDGFKTTSSVHELCFVSCCNVVEIIVNVVSQTLFFGTINQLLLRIAMYNAFTVDQR